MTRFPDGGASANELLRSHIIRLVEADRFARAALTEARKEVRKAKRDAKRARNQLLDQAYEDGFDRRTVAAIAELAALDIAEREERLALLDLYATAAGMKEGKDA